MLWRARCFSREKLKERIHILHVAFIEGEVIGEKSVGQSLHPEERRKVSRCVRES
jgi:hypothetical protein